MNMIPNPKKNVVVDFSLVEALMAVDKIPAHFQNKFTLVERNDVMKMFTFSALEFLSIGVYVDVQLSAVSESKTDITIEVRRKMGAFDQWVEVQNANQHITNLFNALGSLLPKARAERAAHLAPVSAENPAETVSYPHPWETVKQHVHMMVQKYPTTYQVASDSGDIIVLNRTPQGGDDVKLDKICVVKISKLRPAGNGVEVRYEATNEAGRIETKGELDRNGAIAKITVKLVGQATAPAPAASSAQWTNAIILFVVGLIVLGIWWYNRR